MSTSLKKENGVRAIGTALDPASPAFHQIMEPKNYTGVAELFHKQYMTQDERTRDHSGKLIGILFIGLDFTEAIAQMQDKIRSPGSLMRRLKKLSDGDDLNKGIDMCS